MLSFFPRDVLDEILNLIESVSEGFPSYFCFRTNGLKLDLWLLTQKYYQDYKNGDLWLTLTIFYGKVKYRKMLEHMILWKVLKILA